MKRRTAMLFIVLALVIGGIFLYVNNQKERNVMDGPGMIKESYVRSIHYYYGGSDLGDTYRIDMDRESVEMYKCEGNGMPEVSDKAFTTEELSNRIDEIVRRYDMKSWTDLKKSDMFALDEASTSVEIVFDDGVRITFGSRDILPENSWEGVREIVALLESVFE